MLLYRYYNDCIKTFFDFRLYLHKTCVEKNS